MTKRIPAPKNAMIKLITFDLDNTLWDIDPIIVEAERQLMLWVEERVPEAVARLEKDRLLGTYKEIRAQHPDIAHHPTHLRKKILYRVFSESNIVHEQAEQLAHDAFKVFYRFRNLIELNQDAKDLLNALHKQYPLIALTNGNANLAMIGIDHYFDAHFSAETEGRPKPHEAMFLKALAHCGVQAHETIHVGDHPLEDVEAAQALGFRTIWFNENQRQPSSFCSPDQEIHRLTELVEAVAAIAQETDKKNPGKDRGQ